MAFLDRLERDHGDALSLYPGDEGRRMDLTAVLGDPEPGRQVYACGPDRLLAAVTAHAADWPEGALHMEYFTAGATVLDPAREEPFVAELADSGIVVTVDADRTLLEALRAAGIDVPSDCEEGLCGTCEVAVLEGEIDHRDRVLSEAERREGTRMMACCSRARGRVTLAL
jgi:ferredoxin